jgi:nucleoside-diphosphate-sugar epimerase
MKSPILIGGAAGATGSAATKLLLERGFSVRAFVHKEDERSQKLQSLGAEIFVGDVLDFAGRPSGIRRGQARLLRLPDAARSWRQPRTTRRPRPR